MHRTLIGTLAAAAVLSASVTAFAVAAPMSGRAHISATAHVVHRAHNAKLHHTILVNGRGRTLYTLSAERNGRFICTDSFCRSLWTPLTVPRGTKPTGAPRLHTIRRPNGQTQVTYRGRPLYRFNEDRRRGDVKGEGFVDVGTWHAAVVGR